MNKLRQILCLVFVLVSASPFAVASDKDAPASTAVINDQKEQAERLDELKQPNQSVIRQKKSTSKTKEDGSSQKLTTAEDEKTLDQAAIKRRSARRLRLRKHKQDRVRRFRMRRKVGDFPHLDRKSRQLRQRRRNWRGKKRVPRVRSKSLLFG